MLGVCQIVRAGTPDALSGIRLFVRHGHQGPKGDGGTCPPFAGKMAGGYVKIN